jgi:hypothetical protein
VAGDRATHGAVEERSEEAMKTYIPVLESTGFGHLEMLSCLTMGVSDNPDSDPDHVVLVFYEDGNWKHPICAVSVPRREWERSRERD